MKIIGLEIKSREIRIVVLEKNNDSIVDITGTCKPMSLDEDENASNVKNFKNTLFAMFDNYSADCIIINKRNQKAAPGQNPASPISFKIEGIIQLYENAEIHLVHSATLRAFYNKKSLTLNPNNKYQQEALKLAFYYLSK